MNERVAYRTCPLCEATCGLELTLRGDELERVRGDEHDVFSAGYLCPKAIALVDLERDPDRVRVPMVREGGALREATWEEALARTETSLRAVIDAHGRDAVAVYLGNPNAHNLSGMLYARLAIKALGTRNVYSASTVDQMPKHISAALMFGTPLSIPVPDVDRTDYLLMLGANPFASNGSLLTAPDLPGRLRALRRRGGRLVVVDPRRTRTAKEASTHHFIVPGTDAHLLFAIANVLFDEGLVAPGRLAEHASGIEDVRALAAPFTPEAVAPVCGIAAEAVRGIARDLAAAPRAAVYARIGTTTQEFGALCSWLVDVLNVLTGNLDREGGAMFTKPVAGAANTRGTPGAGREPKLGRWRSRVRGLPEVFGELPVACLVEEILEPGDGRIRALVTIAGNPVLSTPDAARLEEALGTLEFRLAVDIYLNETTRHADVLLPAEPTLARGHYDVALYNLACRNVANYSPPTVALREGERAEWETLLALASIGSGGGVPADLGPIDEMVAREALRLALQDPASPAHGAPEEQAWSAIAHRRGPERLLDVMLRAGPYGDGFGRRPGGLTLAALEAAPHGVDFGPLEPRIPEVLRTPSGRIELAPALLTADVERLRGALGRRRNGSLLLVGRRQLRSNNSWMHNLPTLAGGTNRCTALVHPADAARLGLEDGKRARVTSAAGAIEVDVEVTDEVMAGVVSIPHGWGHDAEGARMRVAAGQAGANSNVLAPGDLVDAASGNAVLNGIPVEVAPA